MIFEKICLIITTHVEVERSSITLDSNIKELGADSLALLDILMDIEEEYDVDIPEKKIGTNINDIIAFIAEKHPEEEMRKSA